jgi:PAS domain S-box-containing protein
LRDNLQLLQESDARHAFQLMLSDRLRPIASAEEVTAAACELLGEHLGVSRVVFCEVNESLGTFFVRSEWSQDRQSDMAGVTSAMNEFGPDHVTQLRAGHISVNNDVTLDPRTADHAEGFVKRGIRADLAVPLVKSGALTVVLALHHPAPHQWTEAEIAVVKDTAERTWSAAESVRAQAELRDNRDQSQHLFDTMTEGFSVIDSEWRITQINEEGLRIGGRTKQEVLGHIMWDIWPEVIGTNLDRVYRRVMDTRVQESFEQKIQLSNAHKVSLAITVYPMLSKGIAAFVRDITERIEANEALLISHSRAENALAVAKLGTFDYNVLNRQIECSARSREIFGLTDDQGHNADDFLQCIVASDLPRVRQEIADARAQNRRLDFEYRIQLPDGSIRNIVSSSTCQTNFDGVVVRQVGVVSDVTAQKQAEDKLRDVDRRKDEFLAMLAHELRNPLAPITMAAGILSRPGVNQKTLQEMSAMVVRQASHMTSLIDDLLDVSRINNGLVALEREAVDLKEIVASAVEQVRSFMERQRHDFSMQVTDEALRVEGDRVRLVQVFANILINAAKYTPEGGEIFLDLGVSRSNGDSQAIVLVRDNGVGMSESLLPHVFDIFTQGERTPDRSQGGLGLGLSLVKNLVGLLGGTVTARSEGAGKGSEFTVILPLLANDSRPDDPLAAPLLMVEGAVKIKHIMVVDDNVDAATTVAMLLEMDGHTVSVAHSAEQALTITCSAALYPPQAFLLDIGLPGMDGYELARQLRALSATANATLIALTGYGQPQDRERSRAAGFNHHLEKPVDPDKLLALLSGSS